MKSRKRKSDEKEKKAAGLVPGSVENHAEKREEKKDTSVKTKDTGEKDTAVAEPRLKRKTFILSDAIFSVEPRYHIVEIIGNGAYGIICSAKDLKTGTKVAIKKIENIFEHRVSLAKRTLREMILLRHFDHENIMMLERIMIPRTRKFNSIYIVTELMDTDLACVIRSPQDLTDEHCQFFLYQILRGLKYIHSADVVHRDLKPRNLLVNSNCDLKICDFGLARYYDENDEKCNLSNYVATRWYRAPEVILTRDNYKKSVDLWAVGCILAELIGRRPLFPGRDSFHQITLITSILGSPSQKMRKSKNASKYRDFVSSLPQKSAIPFKKVFPQASDDACDLLTQLLCLDPDQRITVEQALGHRYLKGLHYEDDEPVCNVSMAKDFAFDLAKGITKPQLQELMYSEVVDNYEISTFEPPTSSLDNFATKMLQTLPKAGGTRGRRKSF